ncbi:zinc finger BED domain-containing protein RICESLEEPER 2-like [Canna indica]|uniref:Zinc finger BED domain-containing protein RICESLEEPER 2-like n=1 Tax=Canna indica TaxID=4628 RepID=A0AAQ3KKN8_9LILI|nr:zinc finger BED domain-containing protein RICESLEEPER 2-like [Canna indica]
MSTWRFDQAAIRKSLARMIVKDEYPFSCVDGEGFRDFCTTGMPRFQIPSRQTVQKKILNFYPISSHRGENIGKTIEKCLNDWGIDKVMTITVDNASSNDTAIAFLKKKIKNWPDGCVMDGEFLHMRCSAHCINLIVQDGLKLSSMPLTRIRETIRYIRQSLARLQRSKACVEKKKIKSKLFCGLMSPLGEGGRLPRSPVVDVTFGTRRTNEKYKQKKQIFVVESKTELDRYWDDDPEADDVDVLKWWSVNSGSTGGRVLDEFQSSLALSMVEGLICLQEWIRLRKGKQVVDDLEEVEKLQEEFAKIDFAPPIMDIPN